MSRRNAIRLSLHLRSVFRSRNLPTIMVAVCASLILVSLMASGAPAEAVAAGSPSVGAPLRSGWTSAQFELFDYRANGTAPFLYALLLVAIVVFVVGCRSLAQRVGFLGEGGAKARSTWRREFTSRRGLRRVLHHGIAQRRLMRRPAAGWAHLALSWGFVVLGMGSLLIALDGHVLGKLGQGLPRESSYRAFQGILEFFGLALVLGITMALFRRSSWAGAGVRRSRSALVNLLVLLILALTGFALEALRLLAESGGSEPWSFIGGLIAGWIGSIDSVSRNVTAIYFSLWWGHAILALAFLSCIPWSFMRHAVASPAHVGTGGPGIRPGLTTPFRLDELLSGAGVEPPAIGSALRDLSWEEKLAPIACAEHGECERVCPAHLSGATLSPRALMEKLRLRIIAARSEPETDLLGSTITEEEIWSCTLCGACAEACPVLAHPVDLVVRMRRELILRGQGGDQRSSMLSNLTYAGNPFGGAIADREEIPHELNGRTGHSQQPIVYWIGCAATYDPRVRRIAEAMVRILDRAGVEYTLLGSNECCCGDPARRIGEEGLFQQIALANIARMKGLGVERVITHCAHCYNTLRNEYRDLGSEMQVSHHSQFVRDLLAQGRITSAAITQQRVTVHDSCYAGRINGGHASLRAAVSAVDGIELREMDRHGRRSFCCGGGGGNYWCETPRAMTPGRSRMDEALNTGATTLLTECPYCLKMLEREGGPGPGDEGMKIMDIAEFVAEGFETGPESEVSSC